jgi:hypothetical protein
MIGWFNKSSRPAIPEPETDPVIGIPVQDVVAALAVVDTLAIDRRILQVEVVSERRIKVQTGHATGGLNANVHYLTLERQAAGWQVVGHDNLVS